MSDTAVKEKPEGYVFGRPTKYRPSFCNDVIEWGKLGKSKAWMCASLDISYRTMLDWEAANPDFSQALTRAEMHSQQWWEDAGQDSLKAAVFQSSVWSRSMAARFPKQWREKTAHVGGDEGDQPIKQEVKYGADAFTRSIISGSTAGGAEGQTGGTDGRDKE